MPVVQCPHCRTSLEIDAGDLGYKVLCPECSRAFQAGDAPSPASESVTELELLLEPEPATSETITTRCTECREAVRIGVEDLGHGMVCPICGEKFRAERSPRSGRGEQRNHRRRRRTREEERNEILREARLAISKPATGLMWTGTVMFILYLVIATALGIGGVSMLGSPNAGEQDTGKILIIVAVGIMVFGGMHGAFMAIAGFRMKQLKSMGWCYTGAGLGIATIALSHPLLPTTWCALGFGVWAMSAIHKREVKEAIRLNNYRRDAD